MQYRKKNGFVRFFTLIRIDLPTEEEIRAAA
jgi:hypothetical protein